MRDDYEQYRGYRIRIEPDTDAPDPRRDWDPLGTMICFHRRYDLGDKKDKSLYYHADADRFIDWFRVQLDEGRIVAWRWLYLFDHSGLRMSSSAADFRAWDAQGWDWGAVGIIYLTREKMIEEYGWKVVTSGRKAKLLEYLDNEVKTYDQYLSGDVWGYIIEAYQGDEEYKDFDDDTGWEEIPWGSCWGFYGYKYCLEEAKGEVDGHIASLERQARERLERIETGHRLLFVENMAVGL